MHKGIRVLTILNSMNTDDKAVLADLILMGLGKYFEMMNSENQKVTVEHFDGFCSGFMTAYSLSNNVESKTVLDAMDIVVKSDLAKAIGVTGTDFELTHEMYEEESNEN